MIGLSILMPVRNETAYLAEALDSIRPQAGLRIQVVLVDDRSTDDTFAMADAIARSRGDIDMMVLRNTGAGKAAALNLAFRHATGEAFVLLAGDDRLVSPLLPARARAVLGPAPAVAQCRYRSFSLRPEHDGTLYPRPGRETHLAGGAASFNRAFAELYFPIPEALPNEDSWLRAMAMLHGLPVTFIDEIGLHYRLHDRNSTGPALDFAQTDAGLRQRHAAFALALAQHPGQGSAQGRRRLARLAQAEAHRAAGRWWRLLAMRDLPRADRGVFLANATPWLFAAKRRLLPFLKGGRGR